MLSAWIANYFLHVVEVTEANETEVASRTIVGFAAAGRDRSGSLLYQGELTAIYITQAYQQSGMGRQLVRSVAERLAHMSIHSMQVWVLEANPACQFYERLGGQRLQVKDIAIGGTCLVEVAYGWTDTVGLRNAAKS